MVDLIDSVLIYPKKCRQSIKTVVDEIGASAETAYMMILMTAALMDLQPEDEKVVHIILKDCGIEDDEMEDIA